MKIKSILKYLFAEEWNKLSDELWYAEYDLRNRIEQENKLYKLDLAVDILEALNKLDEKELHIAVTVDTDNSKVIKRLIGKIESDAVQKLLENAKNIIREKLKQ